MKVITRSVLNIGSEQVRHRESRPHNAVLIRFALGIPTKATTNDNEKRTSGTYAIGTAENNFLKTIIFICNNSSCNTDHVNGKSQSANSQTFLEKYLKYNRK